MVREEQQTKNEELLQLAERNQHNAPSASTSEYQPSTSLQNEENFITQAFVTDSCAQVNSRDDVRQPITAERRQGQGWKFRLQNLFCCFAPPSNSQYYRPEPDSVIVKPPQPPTPPLHVGGDVLGPIHKQDEGKKTLVLDLDETLVHSSFRPIMNPHYIIPVEIEGRIVDVYVLKRPLMDDFLAAVGQVFEVVVFTASLSKYADPLLDLLDEKGVVRWRLFRESCYPYEGNYVKNLLCLGRDLANVIIVDNSPHSYVFQPDNALPIGTFIDDPEDVELMHCLEVLRSLQSVRDVRQHLGSLAAQNGRV